MDVLQPSALTPAHLPPVFRPLGLSWFPERPLRRYGCCRSRGAVAPKPYPVEFRCHALVLVASGRTVVDVVASLGTAQSCLYGGVRQGLVDPGQRDGPSCSESAELAAARARSGIRRSK
jgi:hypothetical protein